MRGVPDAVVVSLNEHYERRYHKAENRIEQACVLNMWGEELRSLERFGWTKLINIEEPRNEARLCHPS